MHSSELYRPKSVRSSGLFSSRCFVGIENISVFGAFEDGVMFALYLLSFLFFAGCVSEAYCLS